ncbi:hypothetical protein HOP57_22815 [Halomonas daqingensis]|nr:hypothetical protein [Halomonas desiderata]
MANPAALDDSPPPPEEADLSCDEYMVFAMKDRHHRFSMGLETVLKCLAAAEKEGAVPALPADWWLALDGRYGTGS